MRKLLITALAIAGFQAHSQFTYDYLSAADKYFSKGDYYSAALYYEKFIGLGTSKIKKVPAGYSPYTVQSKNQKGGGTSLKGSSNKQQAVYNLAECYRMLNYPAEAEPHYKDALGFNKTDFPFVRYYYGGVLRSLDRFDEAAAMLTEFINGYSGNDEYLASAKRELKNLEFIRQQMAKKDLGLYSVNKLNEIINPGGANYAPVWLEGQTILFTSSRSDSTVKSKNKNDNRIYQASLTNGVASVIEKPELGQTPDVQQGAAAISPGGNFLYISRWSSANTGKEAAIFFSKKENGQWSSPVKVEELKADGYSTQQPFVTADGKKLLFASNRPGGFGGFDLYEAQLDGNGTVSNISNLGNVINTTGDEQAPSYHAASGTLVFSTNARVGMGGYDFFYSKWINNTYTEPVNFGYPVNSVKDDMYFISRGPSRNILEDVLLSSDRSAACCLELFSLNKQKPLKQISGRVVQCNDNSPMTGIEVKFVDTIRNEVVTTQTTGPDGSYSFTLEEFQPLKAMASRHGFADNSLHFYNPNEGNSNLLRNDDLCLEKLFPPPVGETEELANIYFEYDEFILVDTTFATLDKLAENLIKNPTVKIELAGHTDANGKEEYNLVLSQKRAESCVKYLIDKGVNPAQLVPKGYGESKPIAPNTNDDGTDNPAGRAKNRRTEFKVLEK